MAHFMQKLSEKQKLINRSAAANIS